MALEVLKLICDAHVLKHVRPNETIQSSDLEKIQPTNIREDVADDIIDFNISNLQQFFSSDAWILVMNKGRFLK